MSVFEQVRHITALEAAERLNLKLKRNGSKHWACCPLHGEKTASMCFYSEGTWYCFGCHKGGDAVRLYQELFNMSAKDAALKLAEDFDIRVDEQWTPPKAHKPTAFDLERALEARRSAEWSRLCSAVHRANAILGKYDAHPESACACPYGSAGHGVSFPNQAGQCPESRNFGMNRENSKCIARPPPGIAH